MEKVIFLGYSFCAKGIEMNEKKISVIQEWSTLTLITDIKKNINGFASFYKIFKLHPKRDGPFQVLEQININAYKMDLPYEYNINVIFNNCNLSSFDVDYNLRSNLFENRWNEKNQQQSSNDLLDMLITPIIR